MSSIQVQPAILEKDPAEIQHKINRIKGLVSEVHLDIMDGEFVPNTTVNDPNVIEALDWGDLKISLHLMIAHPELFIRKWSLPMVSSIFFHYEASANVKEITRLIRAQGKQVGMAINPHTPTYAVLDVITELDSAMVMGVAPGWSAQGFNKDVLEKIKFIHAQNPTLPIVVDGGVNAATKDDIIKAGATILCTNSFIFKADNIEQAIQQLCTSPSQI